MNMGIPVIAYWIPVMAFLVLKNKYNLKESKILEKYMWLSSH